jgi:hypothetical protein
MCILDLGFFYRSLGVGQANRPHWSKRALAIKLLFGDAGRWKEADLYSLFH